jgi:hypothetical protein
MEMSKLEIHNSFLSCYFVVVSLFHHGEAVALRIKNPTMQLFYAFNKLSNETSFVSGDLFFMEISNFEIQWKNDPLFKVSHLIQITILTPCFFRTVSPSNRTFLFFVLLTMAHLAGNAHALGVLLATDPAFVAQEARTPKQNYDVQHGINLVIKFFAYLAVHNPLAPINTFAWWQNDYPGQVIGGIMSDVFLWLAIHRETDGNNNNAGRTLCVNDITSWELKHMYHAICNMFPQLANEPNYSSASLKRWSSAFKNVWAFVLDVNGSKHSDQAHLNPLMHCDQERLIQSTMKMGYGLHFIAWMEMACHFGPRFHSFLLTMASENVHHGEDGRWMISYHYVKNNTLMGMSPSAVPQRVSD